jgi:hypothetical protein
MGHAILERLMSFFRIRSKMGDYKITPPPGQPLNAFVSDAPVTDPALDRFKRLPFALRVAETLAKRSDTSSLVVLIHGEWGEGKTTVLEYVHEALYQFENVIPVRFNPWRVSDETSLLVTFFETLANALDKSTKSAKEKIGGILREYGALVGGFKIESHGTTFSAGNAVSIAGEKLAAVSLEDRKARIDRILREAGKRIVVFLDDIDRLDKGNVQAVFKLLKLTADFANVSYVLAFDRDVVAQAIGEQYGAGDARSGYQYLEKIIQVNLNLPLADREALAQMCVSGLNDALKIAGVSLTPDQEQEFQSAFLQFVFPELRTPRLAKLYANSVAFVVPLLAREVNIVDLLLLEAVKFLFPQIHEDIRKFPSIYTGDFGLDLTEIVERGRKTQQHLQAILEKLDGAQAKRAELLLIKLFPQLARVFRSAEYGGDESGLRVGREQRVASKHYLLRYLTCSIPSGDVSDQAVDAFLRGIRDASDEEIDSQYSKLIRPDEERMLLLKFKSRMGDVPIESASRLCLSIARLGSLLPDSPDQFFRLRATAGVIMRQVLERLQKPLRKELALSILVSTEPISFGAMCLSWMQHQANEPDNLRLFSSDEEADLADALAERISKYASLGFPLTGPVEYVGRLLFVWQKSKWSGTIKEQIGKRLAEAPQEVEILLMLYSSYGRTGNAGIDREAYGSLIKVAKPEDLMKAMESAGFLDPSKTDHVAQHARQFAAIYVSSLATQEPDGPPSK